MHETSNQLFGFSFLNQTVLCCSVFNELLSCLFFLRHKCSFSYFYMKNIYYALLQNEMILRRPHTMFSQRNKKILVNPKSSNHNGSRQHSNFFFIFSEKIRLGISCESSAKQTIHIKCLVLLSLRNNDKKTECYLVQFCLVL